MLPGTRGGYYSCQVATQKENDDVFVGGLGWITNIVHQHSPM